MEVSLQDILSAREARVEKQKQLLAEFQKPLLCFTMNIPGPEKYNEDISVGFYVGHRLISDALGNRIVYKELHRENTGCEGYYIVDLTATELKQLAVELEETPSIGRLFDMDVLDIDGKKLSRETPRKCLLCDNDAAVCARSRAHRLDALLDRTGFLLFLAGQQYLAEFIAAQAFLALNQELSTTPKPGLVDKRNRGAHKDMDYRHFFASAAALRPFFCRFAQEGLRTRYKTPAETFSRIRPIGVEAEAAMFQATGGVNTHKGALFSIGLLCAAAGRLAPERWTPEQLAAEVASMTKGITEQELGPVTTDTAKTAGEKIYAQYGISGIRGESEAGFPAVIQVGLPTLLESLQQGLSLNDSGCRTLLHLMATVDDTNLIHRSDRKTQLWVKEIVKNLLANAPYPTREEIEKLDDLLIQKNLSPGGCADLLAVSYFLLFLTR